MKKFIAMLLFVFLAIGCSTVNVPEMRVNKDVLPMYLASVSLVEENGDLHGSGTIIYNRADDYMVVVTAAHVVRAFLEKKIDIYVEGVNFIHLKQMRVFKMDEAKDVAVIVGVNKELVNGPEVAVADIAPNIGDPVFVIGAPLGVKRTVTSGIITNIINFKDKIVYRTNAPMFYGNSGGGMFNKKGELIGVGHAISVLMLPIIVEPGGFYCISLETIRSVI